jgi:hypothetical protein
MLRHPERSNRHAVAQSKDLGIGLTIITLFLLGVAPCIRAQSPAERAMLATWADSLQQLSDAPAIAGYDGPSRRESGHAGDVRRALYQVRHADLTDNRGEIELVLTSMQVMANHTDWAWPHYVMALAFEAMARKHWVETLSDGKALAERHSDAVWRTLRESLDRDETFAPARRLLGELTATQGDRFLRPDQVVALRREARQPVADASALLAWGRHLRTMREYPAALTVFSQAIDRGGDRARLDLELARTIMATRDPVAAVNTYWEGLERLTPVGREAYRFDLTWITDSTTLREFDRLSDAGVEPWLRRFWNARDAEAANHPGERLREHLRRWVVVMENYRALSPWNDAFFTRVEMGFEYDPRESVRPDYNNPGHSGKQAACIKTDAAMFEQLWHMQPSHAGDLRSREPLLDHRGLIYLRHGEPQRRIDGGGAPGGGLLGGQIVRPTRPPVVNAGQARGPHGALLPWSAAQLGQAPDRPNGSAGESWIYGLGGEWHVLQFRGSVALGKYAATTMTQRIPAQWLDDPSVEATIPGMTYVQLAKRIEKEDSSPMRKALRETMSAGSCAQEAIAAAAQTRVDEHFLLNRDTDTPPDLRPSSSVVQAFALGIADDHTGEALLSFAIASEVLRTDVDDSGVAGYSLAFRVVAYDKAHDRTVTVDTVRRFTSTRALAPGQFLTAHLEFALPAGDWHVAVRARQVGGAVAINDARTIHIDNTAPLTLSDVVTGRPGTPDWLATDRITFPVNYTNGWYPDETAELFFEVRGVPAGESYRTTMVRPVAPKSKAAIQIGSTDPGASAVTYVRKSLGLAQLPPGTYTLRVTIEYRGTTAARERQILIVPKP